MNIDEYLRHDAVGLAALVEKKQVTAGELLDAALARMEQVNPKLNAVVQLFADTARDAAKKGLPDGPFRGVPYLLKDITTQLAGTVTTAGSRLFTEKATQDSGLVAAYKRAGFNIFGKTNTPEFALVGITEPVRFGATLNPWNAKRTCGGSSGGAGSAVAAGIVPAAQASDGGGSIRIPASCCGLFGMKPSRGRVSMAPAGEGWAGFTVLHALTRSVRDSAAILDASCQPVAGDPYYLPPPEVPFLEETRRDPPRLRIAMLTKNLNGLAPDPECAEAVGLAAKLCESLGHNVEHADVPPGLDALVPAAVTVIACSLVVTLDNEVAQRGRPVGDEEIEPLTKMLYEYGKAIPSIEYVRAINSTHAIGRSLAEWFAPYDMMLLPTLGQLPLPVGVLDGDIGDMQSLTQRFINYGPNTQLFNASGRPAMSVPLHWTRDGIPVGVQFAGKMGEEGALFRLAAQLEAAQPWAQRRPPL